MKEVSIKSFFQLFFKNCLKTSLYILFCKSISMFCCWKDLLRLKGATIFFFLIISFMWAPSWCYWFLLWSELSLFIPVLHKHVQLHFYLSSNLCCLCSLYAEMQFGSLFFFKEKLWTLYFGKYIWLADSYCLLLSAKHIWNMKKKRNYSYLFFFFDN